MDMILHITTSGRIHHAKTKIILRTSENKYIYSVTPDSQYLKPRKETQREKKNEKS